MVGGELYVSAPGRGVRLGSVDRESGAARFEGTGTRLARVFQRPEQGPTPHRLGIFIDVVAAACLFFSITGLILLQIRRASASHLPLVGGGVALGSASWFFSP